MPSKTNSLVSLIDKKLDVSNFREQHWEGSFWDYLDLVGGESRSSRAMRFSACTT